jgi:hypothetical protein
VDGGIEADARRDADPLSQVGVGRGELYGACPSAARGTTATGLLTQLPGYRIRRRRAAERVGKAKPGEVNLPAGRRGFGAVEGCSSTSVDPPTSRRRATSPQGSRPSVEAPAKAVRWSTFSSELRPSPAADSLKCTRAPRTPLTYRRAPRVEESEWRRATVGSGFRC